MPRANPNQPRQTHLSISFCAALLFFALAAQGRSIETARCAAPESLVALEKPALGTPARDTEFRGWWHDAGELLLHTSNLGFVGDWGVLEGEPSAEWPRASGYEHLYAASLWVGAIVGGDTLVTTAAHSLEFGPPEDDPVYTIYVSASGDPGGEPGYDDDCDGLADEDRLDGIDNDGDTLIDEDYAAFSDEMFACVYFDTADVPYPVPDDPHVPLDIEVFEQSFAWSTPAIDDFVTLRYEITNIGTSTLEDVYVGFFADPDVGHGADESDNYLDDRVAYVDKEVPEAPVHERTRLRMAYCWDAPGGSDGDWDGYVGFVLLDHSTDPDGTAAPSSVTLHAYRAWPGGPADPHSDSRRYLYLSEPLFSQPVAEPADWRVLLSVGPFDQLSPGETVFLEVAVVCGEGLRGLAENALAAVGRPVGPTALERPLGPPLAERGAEAGAADAVFRLAPAAPNPMTHETALSFVLPTREHVELSILSCTGRMMRDLIDRELCAGEHTERWDGRTGWGAPAPSGVYLIRLAAGGRETFGKLVLIR